MRTTIGAGRARGARGLWRFGARIATGVIVALSAVLPAREASAVGFLASSGSHATEERVAMSVSDTRTAVYYQLDLDGTGGPVAIVVPVQDGASLDWSSRAFFEALQAATAPRILAPASVDAKCPGDERPSAVYGDLEGSPTLEPVSTQIFPDGVAVTTWAESEGLAVPPHLTTAMQSEPNGTTFFVALFQAPAGPSRTKALRVVGSGPVPTPAYALDYARAASTPLPIVTFSIGEKRAHLSGTPVLIDTTQLELQAAKQTSNYEQLLFEAFATGTSSPYLVEAASHEALRDNVSLEDNGPVVSGVVHSYFDRAAAYGEAIDTPSSCVAQGASILSLSARVGTACPRGQLGIVGGGPGCTADDVLTGEVDPNLLRCGDNLDDLAVVLSDLEPDEAWLTRSTIVLSPSTTGEERGVSFPGGDRLDPKMTASSVDLSGCPDGVGGMGAGGSTGSSGPTGSGAGTVEVPVYGDRGCGSNGSETIVGYVEEDEETAADAYYIDDCSGDTSTSYYDSADDCSGDTSGDSCSGDTSGADYDTGGCDCSDTGGDFDAEGCSCDGGDAVDCTGGAGADDCDCSIRPRTHRQNRKASSFLYAAVAVLLPIRRWSRKKPKAKAKARR